ncbi:hypothetical protein COOONC_04535 [Cooperia oncophora]
MRAGTLLVITVCALLLISSFECKKPSKDSKKSKDKQYKDKKGETKIEKQKPQKVEKVKAEKAEKVEKQQEPEEIEVDEVIIEAPEVSNPAKNNAKEQVHVHAAESLVDTINHQQRKQIIRPKSLRVQFLAKIFKD